MVVDINQTVPLVISVVLSVTYIVIASLFLYKYKKIQDKYSISIILVTISGNFGKPVRILLISHAIS